ncbi:MAG TPA: sensor histidine kinase [Clostridiales bacterium]|nr:sensor histidine kinase [Clostridiales bacterium]
MLIRYLKDRRHIIILMLLFLLLFAAVFYLSALPYAAVFYGAALWLLPLTLVFTVDFYRYVKKHKTLSALENAITSGIETLPKAYNLIETDYQRLLISFDAAYRAMISASNTEKTEMIDFYTLWVHQIKTPIAAMSVLLQEHDTTENARLAQELFKIERYTELVLGYLRIGDLSADLQIGQYSLSNIVKQAVKKYAPMFIHNKIKLEMGNLNTEVLTDEKWLVFVIEQLLSNALKYTKQGNILLDTKDKTTLMIRDTGIGISREDLPRVFEKGFTGYNGRMDKKSTGLGLYLAKRTLDQLHHKINIESREGYGTTVLIDLSREDSFLP